MNKLFAVLTSLACAGAVGPVQAAVPSEGATDMPSSSASIASIDWAPCTGTDPILGSMLNGLDCGSLEVPLDYAEPLGEQLTIQLTRARHTVPEDEYQGVVLLNRGQWPGGIGRDLPTRFAKGTSGLASDVGPAYDWIGFDPRGVGASDPQMVCDPDFLYPGHAHPDPVPAGPEEEAAWVALAAGYAQSCSDNYGDVLEHLGTVDSARDLESIRVALGVNRLNYLGVGWGTSLGSTYASMYPHRVRRMVLDSVLSPHGSWYEKSLDRNVEAERNARLFFAWVAKYDSVYRLGTTQAAVESNYYRARDRLAEAPLDGRIGAAEWTDIFEPVVYRSWTWKSRAKLLSDFAVRQDPSSLRATFNPPGYPHHNRHATTNASRCIDSSWPRDWSTWHEDFTGAHADGNRFLTWTNAWYHAPCAFWAEEAAAAPKIGSYIPNILLIQPELDPESGVAGATEMHQVFRNSRMVLEVGGHNHNAALSANGNTCLDAHVSSYFRDGTRPGSLPGVDASCSAAADPVPGR